MQAVGQNNSFGRQPLAIGKDRDNVKDVGKVCDGVQDKIQRSPVSGETWDRKMKRKHSLGTVSGSTYRDPFPVESSISHLPQWVEQRPPKIYRPRRANAVSPLVYNCDEMPMPFEGERERNILSQSDSRELSSMVDMVDQPHNDTFLSSQMDLEYKIPSLYDRVLTALIIDDQTDETVGDENISFLHERDDPSVGFYTDTVSCNGNATVTCDKMFMEDKLIMELQSVGIYPKPVAFLKRNLGRCQTFEETRKSCLLDPMFDDVLVATPALDNHTVSTVDDIRPLAQNPQQDFAPPGSFPSREQNVLGNSNHPSNLDFARTGPILNGGKKGKVLPDDVGASAYMGGKKGEMLLEDVGASDSLGGKKGKVLLDDGGASASLRGGNEKVLLDDVGGASASLGGKKRKVLQDDGGASASLGGKKRKVLQDDGGASASLGGGNEKVLLDDVGGVSASLGGKKRKVLQDDGGASASLGGGKEKVLLDDVGASASLGGKIGEVLLDDASLGGKKGEVLLEDVGASTTLGNSFLGGTTRKRSKRGTNKDTSMRNHVKRGGRSSASNTRSERKTKAKAKPKTDGLSISAKGSLGKLVENTNSKHYLASGSDQLASSDNNNVGSVPHDYSSNDLAIKTEDPLDLTNMPELDSIEFGADIDLDSWLNIDVDPLEDDDDAAGLDIPMDDLFTVL